jgi:hypothetical protein
MLRLTVSFSTLQSSHAEADIFYHKTFQTC